MSILRKILAWVLGDHNTSEQVDRDSKPPFPSEVWAIYPDDPFNINRCECVVMEVMEGWVRYQYLPLGGRDFTMRIEEFVRCYSRSKHKPTPTP